MNPRTPAFPSKFPKIGTTIFTVMSALAAETGAVNLGQGFPDFDCDPRLLDAVNAAMREGLNQYPPMTGVAPLREAVAAKIEALRTFLEGAGMPGKQLTAEQTERLLRDCGTILRAAGIARFAWNWALVEYHRLKQAGETVDWNTFKKAFRARIVTEFPGPRSAASSRPTTRCAGAPA